MAAAATYIIKSATFKGTSIDGLEDASWANEADEVLHNTDGQTTVSTSFLDNIRGQVTVLSRNAGLSGTANFQLAQKGQLVIVMQKRADGKGAVSGQDKTLTVPEAMVIDLSGNAPNSDRGSLRIVFRGTKADGTDWYAWS